MTREIWVEIRMISGLFYAPFPEKFFQNEKSSEKSEPFSNLNPKTT